MKQIPSAPGFADLGLAGARVLFVASTGGHLSEIEKVASALSSHRDSALVTFRTPQSTDVPWIDDVRYVPYVKPRDIVGTARAGRILRRMMATERWDAVVSTGAAVAVAALPVAAGQRIRSVYVESFARFTAPSTTGRILERMSGRIELYTQHRAWASGRWRFAGSILDVARLDAAQTTPPKNNRVFVTLGTIEPYRFDRLVDAVLRAAPAGTEFTWQLGSTSRSDLPGRVVDHLAQAEFDDVARQSGLVISHAGVGTAIGLIDMGHRPVLVPRRGTHAEHIDDHQLEIATALADQGLAVACEPGQLDRSMFTMPAPGVSGADADERDADARVAS